LVTGLVLCGLILVLAVVSIFRPEERAFGDIKNQPPGIGVVETVLNSQSVAGSVLGDEWDIGVSEGNEQSGATEIPSLRVATRYAVAGSHYKGRVYVEGTDGNAALILEYGPLGAQYDSETGLLEWDVPEDLAGREAEFAFQHRGGGTQVVGYTVSIPVSKTPHLLGTDGRGRDMARRLFLSTRQIVFPGLIAVVVSTMFGTVLGAVGAYYGGFAGRVIDFMMQVFGSFPRVVLAVVVAMVLKPNIYVVMTVLGVANMPRVASMVQTRVSQLKESQFVEAARELGLRDQTIILKHVIWHNCRPVVFTQGSFIMGEAAALEAALAYIGAGSHWKVPSLGSMIVLGKAEALLYHNYSQLMIPSVALAVAFLSFMLLGDGLCDLYRKKYRILV
jgi:ABC-type dipeptide/oligopeptide/nickel transport system permease subunit